MDEPEAQVESPIERRLKALWPSRPVRDDGRPYALRDIAASINQQSGQNLVTPQYLSMLRSGERTDPSYAVLAGIARFFGVSIAYFEADDATAKQTEEELRLLHALRDSGVRELALCAADLSPESLASITAIVRKIRASEGLPEQPALVSD